MLRYVQWWQSAENFVFFSAQGFSSWYEMCKLHLNLPELIDLVKKYLGVANELHSQ